MLGDALRRIKAHNESLPQSVRRYPIFNCVMESGLPQFVKAILPEALVFYRVVFGTHDPAPRGADNAWSSGRDWFLRLWPHMSPLRDFVDAFIFANEWFGNQEPEDQVRRFVQFYGELIDVLPPGVHCTVGDWGPGSPGYPTVPDEAHQLPLMAPLFEQVIATGNWVNMHLYSPEYNPQQGVVEDGALDMAVGAPYYVMRWETIAARHPEIKIIAGEGSNAGKDRTGRVGVFRPETLNLMRQARTMIRRSPYAQNLAGICWWWWGWAEMHTNAEADWSRDDWSSLTPQWVDMLLEE